MFTYAIESLRFSNGQKLFFEPGSVQILIGPNSSGKSTALRNIQNLIQNKTTKRVENSKNLVIKSLTTNIPPEQEYLIEWLKKNYQNRDVGGVLTFYTHGGQINISNIAEQYRKIGEESFPRIERNICNFLIHLLNTENRLQIGSYKESIMVFEEQPKHHIHVLQTSRSIQQELSEEIKATFGRDINLDWGAGRQIGFRVGKEPEKDAYNDRVGPRYLEELHKLPKLEEDGDGIRSFVGCLLALKCGAHPVLLIDEPEAFLHPTQARRLGSILANTANESKRQIIVSTHSTDIIKGALSTNTNVSVCRVERKDHTNNAYTLKSQEIIDLWSKPLLQSSGAISGIFHEGVIVCEADSDTRLYEAIQQKLQDKYRFNKPLDLYFIHGGGKGEIASLVNSYRSLNVETVGIVDFDILRTEPEFKKLYLTFNGDFDTVEKLYKSVKAALDETPATKSTSQFLSELRIILEEIEKNNTIRNIDKASIGSLLTESIKWSEAKKHGVNSLSGSKFDDCEELLSKCRRIGLFIVPVGELERWWRRGPQKSKNEWIISALQEIPTSSEFVEAEKFMLEVCSYFGLEIDQQET